MSTPNTTTFERWLTNAPEGYDIGGTVTIVPFEKTTRFDVHGTPLRVIGVLPDQQEWQRRRYLSRFNNGMFCFITEEEHAAMMRDTTPPGPTQLDIFVEALHKCDIRYVLRQHEPPNVLAKFGHTYVFLVGDADEEKARLQNQPLTVLTGGNDSFFEFDDQGRQASY